MNINIYQISKISFSFLLIFYSSLVLSIESARAVANQEPNNMLKLQTREGCGLYVAKPDEKYIDNFKKDYSRYTWLGDCIDGLAMGSGYLIYRNDKDEVLGITESYQIYGRRYGYGTYTSLIPGEGFGSVSEGFAMGSVGFGRNISSNAPLEPSKTKAAPYISYFPQNKSDQLSISLLAECYPEMKPCIVESRYSPKDYFAGQKQIPCGSSCGEKWSSHIKPLFKLYEEFVKENSPKFEKMQAEIETMLDKTPTTQSKRLAIRKEIIASAERTNQVHLQKVKLDKQNEILRQQQAAEQEQAAKKEQNDEKVNSLLSLASNIATGLMAYQDAKSNNANDITAMKSVLENMMDNKDRTAVDTPNQNSSQQQNAEFEEYYSKYSRGNRNKCSPDVSQEFKQRWSRFTDVDLANFYRQASLPNQIKTHANLWAPKVKQFSLKEQKNELGRMYFEALKVARNACQISAGCNDGDAEYLKFPMSLNSNITNSGNVGKETGALASLQTTYVARQMDVEFKDEYAYYIWNCM